MSKKKNRSTKRSKRRTIGGRGRFPTSVRLGGHVDIGGGGLGSQFGGLGRSIEQVATTALGQVRQLQEKKLHLDMRAMEVKQQRGLRDLNDQQAKQMETYTEQRQRVEAESRKLLAEQQAKIAAERAKFERSRRDAAREQARQMREQQDRQVDAQIAMQKSAVEQQIPLAENMAKQAASFAGFGFRPTI